MPRRARQNIVGPTIRKLRYRHGWTQAVLTARCQRLGWDMADSTIAKIESQIRCVSDREVLYLAKALRVRLKDVFPDAL
jgi:hypothetical protein